MHVHALAWIILAAIIVTMIVVDIVGHVRTPHEPTLKEAASWSIAYIVIALVFGAIVWAVWGPQYGQEYLGGYITEKALSIDNLFVFVPESVSITWTLSPGRTFFFSLSLSL